MAGDVFASPSTHLIHQVAKRAQHGGGMLLGFGNYAGDVLNFGFATERLRADGINVWVLPVTDDVASASANELQKRRGVAGDVPVFKIAGASAERGDDLDTAGKLGTKSGKGFTGKHALENLAKLVAYRNKAKLVRHSFWKSSARHRWSARADSLGAAMPCSRQQSTNLPFPKVNWRARRDSNP